jgi:DNA-binding transcriptional ArsR family regulator
VGGGAKFLVEDRSTKVDSENAQSTTRHSATGAVQFDSDKVRTWVLPLMKRIYAGDYPTQAGRILGLSRSHVWYYVGKLEKAGLIYKEKRSSAVFYALTIEGSNLLKSCEGRVFPGELYRLDKCQVSFQILQEGRYPQGQFKPVEMMNWTALLGLEQGVKVRHTSRSWIVHVPVIRGKNPAEVYGLAMNLSNRIAVALGKKYGVVLKEGEFVGGEMAVEDPIAKLFGRYFSVRAGRRKIDHSWGEGELENIGKDAAIDYMQMPEKVKQIDKRLAKFEIKFDKLIEALGNLGDMEASPEKLAEGQRRLGEYVS